MPTTNPDRVPGTRPDSASRVVVEASTPQVDCGRFPIKRSRRRAGHRHARTFTRTATTSLAAVVLYRRAGERGVARGADDARSATIAGRAPFTVDALGRYEYTVEGWIDRFASWRHELRRRSAPGRTSRASCSRERRSFARSAVERLRGVTASSLAGRRRRRSEDAAAAHRRRVAAALARRPGRARWRAHPDRSRATRFDRVLERRGRARARAVRRVVRDVPALGRHRSVAQRDVRRSGRAAAVRRVDGLRRALPAADPSDRPQLPQGPEQRADAAARTIPAARGRSDPRRAATRRSSRGSARSTDFDRFVATAAAARARDRARHRLPGVAGSSLRARASRTGSASGPTARSSTPRTRRRNTRTSTRSTSSRRDWQALWHELKQRLRVLDRPRRQDLPRRQPAHQAVPLLGVGARRDQARSIPTRSSCPRRSPGRRSCATWRRSASRSRTPTSRGGTRRRS